MKIQPPNISKAQADYYDDEASPANINLPSPNNNYNPDGSGIKIIDDICYYPEPISAGKINLSIDDSTKDQLPNSNQADEIKESEHHFDTFDGLNGEDESHPLQTGRLAKEPRPDESAQGTCFKKAPGFILLSERSGFSQNIIQKLITKMSSNKKKPAKQDEDNSPIQSL